MVLQTALHYFDWWSKKLGRHPSKPHFVTTTVEHDAILLPLRHYESQQQAGSNTYFFSIEKIVTV